LIKGWNWIQLKVYKEIRKKKLRKKRTRIKFEKIKNEKSRRIKLKNKTKNLQKC